MNRNNEFPAVPGLCESKDSYQPRRPSCFDVNQIVVTKGVNSDSFLAMIEKIAALYPEAPLIMKTDCAHNQSQAISDLNQDMLAVHKIGKRTLLFGVHQSSIRYSQEENNTCPNYWHFSLYGFCPYGCTYCYLAGTTSVRFSPAVKIFVNVNEILDKIHRKALDFQKPESFYHGKLQDGLALDPLTGYSRKAIPFFAREKFARQVILTKSADVQNLLDLEHGGHTAISWTLNLPEIQPTLEPNTPSIVSRIEAMKKCFSAGYPVRIVLMPLILVENWQEKYALFIRKLLGEIPVERLTIGGICSFSTALFLMNRKLGVHNIIYDNLETSSANADGRSRYAFLQHKQGYEYIIRSARSIQPDLDVGICLENEEMLCEMKPLGVGKCNCVW